MVKVYNNGKNPLTLCGIKVFGTDNSKGQKIAENMQDFTFDSKILENVKTSTEHRVSIR